MYNLKKKIINLKKKIYTLQKNILDEMYQKKINNFNHPDLKLRCSQIKLLDEILDIRIDEYNNYQKNFWEITKN